MTEKDNAKVSVIIPTYKRPVSYLSRAVRSITEQTYDNVEIIVVDDSPASYEHRDEIKQYMASICSEQIIYLQNEKNLGGSLARNRGIEKANGRFITFLDDDDEYKPQKIENQVKFMQEGDYDLTFSDMIMYGTNGAVVDYRDYKDIPAFDNESLLYFHLTRKITGTPTFMFKAEKLKEIGGFDDAKSGQEYFLMLKAIESGLKIGYLPRCDVKVYKHADGGITQSKDRIAAEQKNFEFKKKYYPRLNKKQIQYIAFRHWAAMVVAYKRNHMYMHMIGAGIKAFVASPVVFFKEGLLYAKKIIKYNRRK